MLSLCGGQIRDWNSGIRENLWDRTQFFLNASFLCEFIQITMENHQLSQREGRFQVAGFIRKTFQILNNLQFNKIIFWAQGGKEFAIKDVARFQDVVLPKYFRHRNINSFIRQLNMYGFHKGKKDSSKCIFSHPNFIKDKESSLHLIKRKFKNSELTDQLTPKLSSEEEEEMVQDTPIVIIVAEPVETKIIQSYKDIYDVFETPVKNAKYLISTRELINTGPSVSMVKLSQFELRSKISEDSDRQDCLSIEDQIQRNNSRKFSNRVYGISFRNTYNNFSEQILFG